VSLGRDGFPMIANSPRLVAEPASGTVDPDEPARRANTGEPSAGFQSDLTIDEDAVHRIFTTVEFAPEPPSLRGR